MNIERIAARIAAVGFHKQDGSELSSKELKFIKAVAAVMNRPWQAIAARPADSAILLAEMDKGPEAAAEAYRKRKTAGDALEKLHGTGKHRISEKEAEEDALKLSEKWNKRYYVYYNEAAGTWDYGSERPTSAWMKKIRDVRASVKTAVDWKSEATSLEKTIGKAIAQNASKVISVTVSASSGNVDDAEVDVFSGELVNAVKEALWRQGWRIDDLSPAKLTFGLRRIS